MKTAFKFGFLALAISLTVAACDGSKTKDGSTDTTAVDSTIAPVDTAAIDTTSLDSTTLDTTKAVPVQ